jgi:hypothetical protein
MKFNRRQFLQLSGGVAAASAFGEWKPTRAAAAPGIPSHDSLIDVAGAATLVQSGVHGHNTSYGLQGMAMNNASGTLYVTQVKDTVGGLVLTRLTKSNGVFSEQPGDHMTLNGFGHGIAFGVQDKAAAGGADRIWMECNAVPDQYGHYFGSAIGHFPFAPGTTLDTSNVSYPFSPMPGAINYSCVSRDTTNCLLVRAEQPEGSGMYQGYHLDTAVTGVAKPYLLTPRLEPSAIDATGKFQGWTFDGQYAYTLDGGGEPGDSRYVTSIDLNAAPNASWVNRSIINVDPPVDSGGVHCGEPEGITWISSNILWFSVKNFTDSDPYHYSDVFTKG